jgi:hypothetical protein
VIEVQVMSNPCLVIIFNHKYDDNIARLEAFYQKKFNNIFFLVPFYTGSKENVIPVYESSFYFQGYIAQGFKHFFRPEFTHYFFIGDDLIINPAITERNYQSVLNIGPRTSYIPEIQTFDTNGHWSRKELALTFFSSRYGSEGFKELPSYEEALKRFADHNVKIGGLKYRHLFGPLSFKSLWASPIQTAKNLFKYYWRWRANKSEGKVKLPYPVVYAYSDIAVVSTQCIQRFCHLCGVLSAQGIFVEVALPTALLLAAESIATDANITLVGKALWTSEEVQEVSTKFAQSLDKLEQEFPKDVLYYHPIKLSKWK